MPTHYERRSSLEHRPPALFVTLRLADSLPANRPFPPAAMTTGETFAAMDHLLDQGASGPLFLKQAAIATLVVKALRDGDDGFHRYELHSFVVMPKHVHLLVTPRVDTTKWLGPLKQDESYDHLVRSPEELDRIRAYIENNPVKAGLVAAPELFPWSSAAA